LEGFNARVDSQQKKLVAAGPVPAAPVVDHEAAILAQASLAERWAGTEADEAWKHLNDLPAV
jgi:hypothetical protein